MKLYRTQHEYDTKSMLAGATVAIGSLVKLTSGKLELETSAPEYIVLQAGVEDDYVLVHEIRKDEEYSALLSADATALTPGAAVTVTSGGAATATTTNGIFQILEFPTGVKTSGGLVIGRFI